MEHQIADPVIPVRPPIEVSDRLEALLREAGIYVAYLNCKLRADGRRYVMDYDVEALEAQRARNAAEASARA